MTETSQLDDSDAILAALIEERDLAGKATISQLALCRQAATLLANPTSSSASSVAQLLALLPRVVQPKSAAEPEREWDLTLLSPAEIIQLERLACKAQSLPSPDIEGTVSRRMASALDLVTLLDAVEDVDALPPAQRHQLETEVRNAVYGLVYPPFLPSRLFAQYAGEPSPETMAELKALREKCARLEHELSLRAPNVVQLQRQRTQAAAEGSDLAAGG